MRLAETVLPNVNLREADRDADLTGTDCAANLSGAQLAGIWWMRRWSMRT
jgi:uncharacterized protein YjbI with pentapeptide repeats